MKSAEIGPIKKCEDSLELYVIVIENSPVKKKQIDFVYHEMQSHMMLIYIIHTTHSTTHHVCNGFLADIVMFFDYRPNAICNVHFGSTL